MWITTQFLMSRAGIGKYRREAGFAHWVSANSCCWQHNSHESIRVFPGHLFVCLCVFVSSKSPTLSYVRTKTQHCFVLRPRSVSQSSVPFFFLLSVRFPARSQPLHTRGFQFTFISSEEELRKQSKGNSRKCLTGVCADQWICSA